MSLLSAWPGWLFGIVPGSWSKTLDYLLDNQKSYQMGAS
jgi:hypothetical protein